MRHSGVWHPRLDCEQPILYLPASGTTLTGRGLGPDWAGDGVAVVSHPTPASGFTTQFRRTRFTSAASADNELGVHLPNAADMSCYRGSVASRGGFFFRAWFMVNAIPNTTIRFFAGLSAATTGVCLSDTVPANTVGLWCDTTDAGSLTVVTNDASAGSSTKNALASAHTLTAGTLYEFTMQSNPAQGSIVTQLVNKGTDAVIGSQNVSATMPATTTMMGPQVGLSNAANAAGGDTSLDIILIYARPNLKLVPDGSGT